jgi:hypothetical protein
MDAAGRDIVEDAVNFPQFKAVKNAQFNAQTTSVSINTALEEMQKPKDDDSSTGRVSISESESNRILDLYKIYHQTEEILLTKYLRGYDNFLNASEAASRVLALVQQLHVDARSLAQIWDPIPIIKILAGIGAIWTISTSGKEFWDSGRKKDSLLRLHVVQVIGLIRLLKLSEEGQHMLVEKFADAVGFVTGGLVQVGRKLMANGHMIQVGTGEGKSVLLGVLSCFLAMTGIQVRCACYSQLLSRRDYSDFETLFKKFNVQSLIRYSTIDELAEECINQNGDIRSLALRHIGRSSNSAANRVPASSTKKVLLIDEVKFVFFICLILRMMTVCVIRSTFFSATRSWDRVTIPLLYWVVRIQPY